MGAVLAQGQASSPLRLKESISLPGVKGRIDHMAFDLAGKRLFVAALGNNTVEVINIASGKVAGTISGLAEPQGLLYQPELHRLWVANGSDGTVRIFDARTYRLLRTISLGDDADNIRADPVTHRVFVGYGSGGIAVFDANGAKLADIKLPVHPESFQLEKNSPLLFVNLPHAHKLDVIDRAKSAVVASWTTDGAQANFPMALDEGDHRLFIVCRDPAVLLVLDSQTGAIIAKLPTVGDSDDIFYDRTRKRLYVSGGEGAVDVVQQIDRDHYRRIAQVATSSGARTSFYVPQLSLLFVAGRQEGASPAEIRVFRVAK
ncbi:MAG: YncE family protein [Acidobacteriota bacterium]|nr:YncE family protein [Acidobacteriota bacterium]